MTDQHTPTPESVRLAAGAWYILPTPFAEDESLDVPSLRRLVRLVLEWDVVGLTILGMMAEPTTLTDDERRRIVDEVLSTVDGAVPVAVGCSAQSRYLAIRRIEEAVEAGARAVMIAPPDGLANVDLLPQYFADLASASRVPIVLQDEPMSTGVRMPVSVIRSILEVSGITHIKLEDPPSASKLARVLNECPEVTVYGGMGGLYVLEELARGSHGSMTGFAYPEVLAAIRERVMQRDVASAQALFDRFLPLMRLETQPVLGLGVRKEVLRLRGAISTARTRGLSQLDAEARAGVAATLRAMGVEPSPDRFNSSDA